MTEKTNRGKQRLLREPDPDTYREHFRKKDKRLRSRLTTVQEAVSSLISNGDYLAIGGFGSNRIPTAVLHEIVRKKYRNLGLSGHIATHDGQILAAGDCFDRCDVGYVVGLEARGLSRKARKMFESGDVETVEWTNAALAWRYKAAAMGLPFIPARDLLGTDTFRYSAAREITCPYTGETLVALPALNPDVAVIHVHRADKYGNCQIDGIVVSDDDVARASKRVIITAEKIIPHDDIRRHPERTIIPYWCVDAVCEVPYGSYPANMPGEYFSDEDHLKDWLDAEKDPDTYRKFLDEHIFSVRDFNGYLEKCGGIERLRLLRSIELGLDGEDDNG